MPTLKEVAGHINPRYGAGSTTVWYMRPVFFRDGIMGPSYLEEKGKLPQPKVLGNLEATHVCLGCVDVGHLDEVYDMMQGENWSPNGEARPLIEALGLGHTTLSVGDVIMKGDGACFMVDGCGFRRLP